MAYNIIHFLVITILIKGVHLNNYNIVFLNVVFRHGDRAPDTKDGESYPTDPYRKRNFDPAGDGGLTNDGKKRQYELGAKLRSEYNDFLGDTYKPYMVTGRSTNYDRTKMSLMLVLSGLYPPKDNQVWNKNLIWQPIPMRYFPAENDILMAADSCPQYKEEFHRVEKSADIQAEYDVFHRLIQNLTIWTGATINTTRDMFNLYHTLMAQTSMNLKLPKWANDIFPDGLLCNATVFDYKLGSFNVKLRRLYGGMLLRNIIDVMDNVIDQTQTDGWKINLFSGHETNIASFLLTLGVYEPHVPQYSSSVIVELLEDDADEYYVKVRYYLGIPSKFVDVQIRGCEIICPIGEFKRLLKSVTPSDEEMNCPHDKPIIGF